MALAAHPMAFIHRLSCGLCGFVSPRFNNTDNDTWAPYFRAVYVVGPLPPSGSDDDGTGPDSDPDHHHHYHPHPHQQPRLSGVGFFRHDRPDNYVPVETHRRCVDEPSASAGDGDGTAWYYHTLHGFFQVHGNGGGGGGGVVDPHHETNANANTSQDQQQQYHHHYHHDNPVDGQEQAPAPSPPRMVRIRGIAPPGGEVPAEEQAGYAWGFLFHEACWAVLEQAARPGTVDVGALWRVLCSVPCGADLPNWGHNYGGLYVGSVGGLGSLGAGGPSSPRRGVGRPVASAAGAARESRRPAGGAPDRESRFVLLARYSNLVIPSTFHNPLRVPELRKLVAQASLEDKPGDDENGERGGRPANGDGEGELRDGEIGSDGKTAVRDKELPKASDLVTPPPLPSHPSESEEKSDHMQTESSSGTHDPFMVLPLELKELLLSYAPSSEVANLRLASRAMAAVPLSQQFFRSRFWPGREMHVFFDAFLPQPQPQPSPSPPSSSLSPPQSQRPPVTNWARLYWMLKIRRRYNRVGLGERNRLRLWDYTVRPLIEAVDQVARMSELKGRIGASGRGGLGGTTDEYDMGLSAAAQADSRHDGDDYRSDTDSESTGSGDGDGGRAPTWRARSTAKFAAPLVFGAARRVPHWAEVELPVAGQGPALRGVHVSFVRFFGARYITGLRFVFGRPRPDEEAAAAVAGRELSGGVAGEDEGGDGGETAIGYVLRGSETYLPVYGTLDGFHTAVDECGFRAIALMTGQHMVAEYLDWAGDVGSLAVTPMKTAGRGLRRVRAAFDVSYFGP